MLGPEAVRILQLRKRLVRKTIRVIQRLVRLRQEKSQPALEKLMQELRREKRQLDHSIAILERLAAPRRK